MPTCWSKKRAAWIVSLCSLQLCVTDLFLAINFLHDIPQLIPDDVQDCRAGAITFISILSFDLLVHLVLLIKIYTGKRKLSSPIVFFCGYELFTVVTYSFLAPIAYIKLRNEMSGYLMALFITTLTWLPLKICSIVYFWKYYERVDKTSSRQNESTNHRRRFRNFALSSTSQSSTQSQEESPPPYAEELPPSYDSAIKMKIKNVS
ncbi:hypothetical protein QR680_007902 [Steinernema hermaphroditum]|uniref:Uncharacterized protein n=1 Tax=Steinernema hermaphroditum TaxID=289476 RepID=A0AA39M6P2_9BILA|nr:hypothetical protein QR680_007902 [Steinernema hermaphroditum]